MRAKLGEWRGDDTLRFRQDLFRSAAYEGLSFRRRSAPRPIRFSRASASSQGRTCLYRELPSTLGQRFPPRASPQSLPWQARPPKATRLPCHRLDTRGGVCDAPGVGDAMTAEARDPLTDLMTQRRDKRSYDTTECAPTSSPEIGRDLYRPTVRPRSRRRRASSPSDHQHRDRRHNVPDERDILSCTPLT